MEIPKEINRRDTEAFWKFLVTQVRSTAKARKGRVARKRIDPFGPEVWKLFIRMFCRLKKPEVYIENYRHYSASLHKMSLSLEEKVDLYYALELEVHESLREEFIEKFHVELNEDGVITGSSVMEHWDDTHPDSDCEEKRKKTRRKDRAQDHVSEKEDGDMWKFLVERVNQGHMLAEESKRSVWKAYVRENESQWSAEMLNNRFWRTLVPNLHLMPFDLDTIAALFEDLEVEVPEDFRERLMTETGVKLNKKGKIRKNARRPDVLVLQSQPPDSYDSPFGITSATTSSKVKRHTDHTDHVAYTDEEEQVMWECLLEEVGNGHRGMVRPVRSIFGISLWKECIQKTGINRTCHSLAAHCANVLTDKILDTHFDMLTKIGFYYIFNKPLTLNLLEIFQKHAAIWLKQNKTIRLASSGAFWRCGQLGSFTGLQEGWPVGEEEDSEGDYGEEGVEDSEGDGENDESRMDWERENSEKCRQVAEESEIVARQTEKHELFLQGDSYGNSVRYPYILPRLIKPKGLNKKKSPSPSEIPEEIEDEMIEEETYELSETEEDMKSESVNLDDYEYGYDPSSLLFDSRLDRKRPYPFNSSEPSPPSAETMEPPKTLDEAIDEADLKFRNFCRGLKSVKHLLRDEDRKKLMHMQVNMSKSFYYRAKTSCTLNKKKK